MQKSQSFVLQFRIRCKVSRPSIQYGAFWYEGGFHSNDPAGDGTCAGRGLQCSPNSPQRMLAVVLRGVSPAVLCSQQRPQRGVVRTALDVLSKYQGEGQTMVNDGLDFSHSQSECPGRRTGTHLAWRCTGWGHLCLTKKSVASHPAHPPPHPVERKTSTSPPPTSLRTD